MQISQPDADARGGWVAAPRSAGRNPIRYGIHLDVPTVDIGFPVASPDPSGTGGMIVAWAQCLRARSRAVNPVFHVLRLFPPSSPIVPFPQFLQCDSPEFTRTTVTGGTYILNPSVAVESESWSRVKALYAR